MDQKTNNLYAQATINKITYDNDVNFIQYIVAEHRFVYLNLSTADKSYEFDDPHFISSFHPADRHNGEKILKMMTNRENHHYGCECRYYLPRIKDFSWQNVDVNVYETDEQGNVVSYMAVCRSMDKWYEMKKNLTLFRKKVSFITRLKGILFVQYDVRKNTFFRLDDTGEQASHEIPLSTWMANFHPDDQPQADQLLKVLQERSIEKFHTEYRYKFPAEYKWFSVDVAAYERDDTNDIVSYMCLAIDIDESKNNLIQLAELRDRAESSNRMKDLFIEQLSHEIRTPLNSILGFSELISNKLSDEECDSFKEIIRENSSLLLRIINDTMDISLIEAGLANTEQECFNTKDFFTDFFRSMNILIKSSIKLCCEHGENVNIISDRRVFREIISSFVANANKFTSSGTVVVSYHVKDNGMLVKVKDTGIGIKEEDQQRIFNRFEKIDSFTQGMGMGLAVCKSLVEKMNGKIGVESALGKGSTFWFWIPCEIK